MAKKKEKKPVKKAKFGYTLSDSKKAKYKSCEPCTNIAYAGGVCRCLKCGWYYSPSGQKSKKDIY